MSFYVIFSGLVGVVIDDDEDKAFENEEKPANVLKKGDSFGVGKLFIFYTKISANFRNYFVRDYFQVI